MFKISNSKKNKKSVQPTQRQENSIPIDCKSKSLFLKTQHNSSCKKNWIPVATK